MLCNNILCRVVLKSYPLHLQYYFSISDGPIVLH